MIKFNQVYKDFKTDFWKSHSRVLDGISFSVREGKVTGFLGANGSGKTTCIKIMMDFIKKDSGEITFDAKLGSSKKEVMKSIGYLPEHPYFYPYLSGREFASYLMKLSNVEKKDYDTFLEDYAKRLKIADALDREIRGYSKGMLQRLGFLVSILHNPKVLILDEPLSGVDPIGRSIMKKMILELKDKGVTIFFSSHIVSDLEEVCDDVVILEKGKIVYSGDKIQLLKFSETGSYKIVYKLNEGIVNKRVLEKEKNEFLNEVLKKGGDILSVELETPNLEDVVYKLRRE